MRTLTNKELISCLENKNNIIPYEDFFNNYKNSLIGMIINDLINTINTKNIHPYYKSLIKIKNGNIFIDLDDLKKIELDSEDPINWFSLRFSK